MAFNELVEKQVAKLVEPIVTEAGFELVEVQYRGEAIGQVLRIVIFSESGISLGDCGKISKEVGYLLEIEDLIDQAYHLEVSSPGLDRPLKVARDFQRYRGRKVTIILTDSSDKIVGTIEDVLDDVLILQIENEKERFPLSDIVKARLVIEFNK
ncbi:MAG: ribosome maturation factor RimP [Proteobacteria bacterium]|nr:ribosome maturation factor RimP [Pseudomonadota bacterium]MBU1716194.1 ribosome maturation factor RimP [Pseudomonadota bacterium]